MGKRDKRRRRLKKLQKHEKNMQKGFLAVRQNRDGLGQGRANRIRYLAYTYGTVEKECRR